ncbi:hypothetical protein Tco_0596021 [Tanacetum coccineum]
MCKHAQRIQELLVYVRDTCPNAINLSAKKVESSTTSDSNTAVLSPTGLKCSTSNCGSKLTCNKKNDMISRTPSRNMKNKVEAQPRKVNKKNSVVVRTIPGCCPDCTLVSGLWLFETHDRESLLAHELYGSDIQKNLYNALVESYNNDNDIMSSYGDVVILKRGRDDQDKDEDPSAGSDRGMKRRKSGKDAESSKDLRSKERSLQAPPKTLPNLNISLPASLPMQRSQVVEDLDMQQDQEFVTGDNDEQPTDKEVKYDQHAYLGTSHWGPKRQRFYGYASNLTSSKDVYSRRRIIAVTKLRIMKMYDYGHLEEIEVRRDDQKLYTFKEGDFKRLRLQDTEDMLFLLVQQKLTNLTIDKRYDINVALCMYTRWIVIQKRVEDLQLGFKRKRLLRTDELHKFSDGTFNDVRTALHDIVAGIRIEYLPMRKWSDLDKKRAWVMVQDIDKHLYQRRLIRNLEKFIGGRECGNDLRLLERTI